MSSGFAAKLPLTFSNNFGPYELITNYENLARQNLKMLVLTNPGERMMIPEFGVGMYTFLFEPDTPVLYNSLEARVKSQTKKYLPYVAIQDVQFRSFDNSSEFDANRALKVTVNYIIKPLNTSDVLTVSVSSGY